VVAYLGDLYHYSGRRYVRAHLSLAWQVARSGAPLVVIRGDLPFAVKVPRYASRSVWPSPTSATCGGGDWLPFLPQRALRSRTTDRASRIETMVLHAYIENVPQWVLTPEFHQRLAALGVTLRISTAPAEWPDFSGADIALCARATGDPYESGGGGRFDRKPPTKLVNAWVAGTIPLISDETAYLDLAKPGDDALLVDGPDDVIAAVTALTADPDYAEQLLTSARARGTEFAAGLVLDQWEQYLSEPLLPTRRVAAWLAVGAALASLPLGGIHPRQLARWMRSFR